jgi:Ser/Thr protein kinase RdoA (MazF antagonist)
MTDPGDTKRDDDRPGHDDARDVLASYVDRPDDSDDGETKIVRQLHDVPPYRVYEVRLDGRRAVLKLDAHPRGHAAVEGRVQAYAADRTPLSVPPVLAVASDHYLVAWDDAAAAEAGDHAATDSDNHAATGSDDHDETWCRVAGTALARLHDASSEDVSGYGAFRVRASTDDSRGAVTDGLGIDAHETWREAVISRLDHHRTYLEARGYADVVDAVIAYVEDHPEAFAAVGEPVCCHGNVLPDHLAVVDGDPAALIDFEHALAAPAGYDYWRTAGPVFRGSADEDRLERAFRAGYESVRPLPESVDSHTTEFQLVNTVAYLEALFLQQNRGPTEREELAERMQTHVTETLASLRE